MRIYWSIKKRLIRLFRKRYVVVKRLGFNFLLDNKNWIDTRLLIGQPYEKAQLNKMRDLANEEGCEVFLDIGSNIGLYTIFLSQCPRLSEIHAYEPVRRNFYQMQANLLINGLESAIKTHNCALSDHSYMAEINIDPSSTGISRIDIGDRDRDCFKIKEEITCVQLDENQNWKNKKIIIKMDVEGHELAALKGMRKALIDNKVIIFVEAFEGSNEMSVSKYLKELSFKEFTNPGGDHLFANFDLARGQDLN